MGCCGGKNSATVEVLSSVELPLLEMNREIKNFPGRLKQLVELIMNESEVPKAEDWKNESPKYNYASRLRALNGAIDLILLPVTSNLEKLVEDSGGEKRWDQVGLRDVIDMLLKILRTQHPETQQALRKLLSIVNVLWSHQLANSKAQHLCMNTSINQLATVLQLTIGRRVVLENRNRSQQLLREWGELCSALVGEQKLQLSMTLVSPCLDAGSKAALLYTSNIAARGETKFSFTTARESPLDDGLKHAEAADILSTGCHPTKLFPTFQAEETGVEQGEGHGPRKEYFALVGQQLVQAATHKTETDSKFAANESLMTFNRAAGCLWMNEMLTESRTNRARVRYLGWLLAQAVCNRASLGVPLAEVLFTKLIESSSFSPTLAVLQEFDPEAAAGLTKVMDMSPAEIESLCELEGIEAGSTAQEYVQHSVNQILIENVEWQSEALASGWALGLDVQDLAQWSFTAADMCSVVCGAAAKELLPMRELFRVVEDQELTECPQLMAALWEAVDKLNNDGQAKLMHFITGSSRAPIPGTELLRLEMAYVASEAKEPTQVLHRLPQAHSCENMLEVPNYWAALQRLAHGQAPKHAELVKIVSERLAVACEYGHGYALDDIGGGQPSSSPPPARSVVAEPRSSAQSGRAQEASIDSWSGQQQPQQQTAVESWGSGQQRQAGGAAAHDSYRSSGAVSSASNWPDGQMQRGADSWGATAAIYTPANIRSTDTPQPSGIQQQSFFNGQRRYSPPQSIGISADMGAMGRPPMPGAINQHGHHRQQNNAPKQHQDVVEVDMLDELLEELNLE